MIAQFSHRPLHYFGLFSLPFGAVALVFLIHGTVDSSRRCADGGQLGRVHRCSSSCSCSWPSYFVTARSPGRAGGDGQRHAPAARARPPDERTPMSLDESTAGQTALDGSVPEPIPGRPREDATGLAARALDVSVIVPVQAGGRRGRAGLRGPGLRARPRGQELGVHLRLRRRARPCLRQAEALAEQFGLRQQAQDHRPQARLRRVRVPVRGIRARAQGRVILTSPQYVQVDPLEIRARCWRPSRTVRTSSRPGASRASSLSPQTPEPCTGWC